MKLMHKKNKRIQNINIITIEEKKQQKSYIKTSYCQTTESARIQQKKKFSRTYKIEKKNPTHTHPHRIMQQANDIVFLTTLKQKHTADLTSYQFISKQPTTEIGKKKSVPFCFISKVTPKKTTCITSKEKT